MGGYRGTDAPVEIKPEAKGSDRVRRGWTHARMVGRRVSPVLADASIKRSDLPAWIRREEVYDLAEPERWALAVAPSMHMTSTRARHVLTNIGFPFRLFPHASTE